MNLDTIFFPQNKFKNTIYTRQKFNVKFQTEACLDYFNISEDKHGFRKFYLDTRILYYVLTDKVCNSITWRKSQGIVVIEQQDDLMPEFVFLEESWKCILSTFCVYLDQEQKHIYGRQDVLLKLQSLFEAYAMFMKIEFKQTEPQLTNDDLPF